jgi:hypothetical protein
MTDNASSSKPAKLSLADRVLVDEQTAAEMLGVSRTTFRALAAQGLIQRVQLPALAGGGRLKRNLYTKADLEALVQGFKAGAA